MKLRIKKAKNRSFVDRDEFLLRNESLTDEMLEFDEAADEISITKETEVSNIPDKIILPKAVPVALKSEDDEIEDYDAPEVEDCEVRETEDYTVPQVQSNEGQADVASFEDRPKKSKKNKKNRKKRKKKMSPLLKILITILILGTAFIIASTSYFDVDKYKVEGSSYYSQEEIVIMGDCKTGGNIFWGSNLKDIESRLEQDPYIEAAKTKRLLPNRILIEVKERRQVAAVVYGDNYVVIDNEGLVLRNTKVEPQLTLIQGVTISKIEVGQPIEIEEKVKFRQITEMIDVMESSDMYFSKIVATKTGVDAYVLDNLLCEGSPQNIMEAMRERNLQKVVNGLFDLKIERGTIKISGGEYISFNPAIE